MLTSFDQIPSRNTSTNKRIRWPYPIPIRGRHLMCRLPFLVVWTFVAIILLYKSLSNNPDQNVIETEKIPEAASRVLPLNRGRLSLRRETGRQEDDDVQLQATSEYQSKSLNAETTPMIEQQQQPIVISNTLQQTIQPSIVHQTSTVKKTSTEFNRKSKVFILLVQSSSTSAYNKHKTSPLTARRQMRSSNKRDPPGEVNFAHTENRPLKILNHIRVVVEILESHRIDYVIEGTRLGLPTTLLTDTNEDSPRFSVIVIDNFLGYTKLDRWMRDQLDRHCRKNQIGVVTFLNPDELNNNRRSVATQRASDTGRPVGLTTEESITDQFPLTLKPIIKPACKKTTACHYDYQLNDQSSILRILKRKRNFVVSSRLINIADSMPWISMSSDHVTYEPLTWARFDRSYIPQKPGNRFMPRPRRNTQDNDLTMSSSVDDLLPSMEADAKHEQDDSDAYELTNGSSTKAAARLHAARARPIIGVTQGYGRNQLQAAMEQNLHESIVPNMSYNNENMANHASSTVMHVGSGPYSYATSKDSNNINNDDDNRTTTTSNNSGQDYEPIEPEPEALSMFDRGLYDGIKRVIFGRANHHWLDRILLLDAIEHLSSGRILTPLERYIQIDIDDIFVGEQGKRMNHSDVDALIDVQERFTHLIDGGFKFNLGFSGKYFKHGDDIANAADEYLISKANHFNWFCHTWSHSKAHLMNNTNAIEMELRKNLQFARQHQLPLIGHGRPLASDDTMIPETYAIAPHHSGVYPVHEQLYEAWRKVLNVRVTSTEEYPSLRPANQRRAFVHNTIKVLPRQTCGLYTHTIYRDKYPGGVEKLEDNIRGGELFETVLHNLVNIYMTHMSNYAHDRLALSTFSALIEFVQTHTNLLLKHAPSERGQLGPNQLADYYFSLFPHEQQPVFTNPCKDTRHLAIWAPEKHKYCSVAPQLLIVGPQKTGTTALYSFLRLHPEFRSSIQSPVDFEEVQFFNDKHYSKGVDWYFSRFLSPTLDGDLMIGAQESNEQQQLYYFDKSATYYDDPKVARRAKGLLPEAKIVILLVDPADRAYSWYQHIKAHGDRVANSMSFEHIIMSSDDGYDGLDGNENNNNSTSTTVGVEDEGAKVRALRNRCLQPGYYSVHLSRWLEYFPSRQIIIIDGQWFRQNPASVLNKLQLILRVEQRIDYENLLVFNEKKGFFCYREQLGRKEIKCLGQSKGRKYTGMSREARLFLNRHYLGYNKQLARLMADIGQPLPVWLDEAIREGRRGHLNSMVFS